MKYRCFLCCLFLLSFSVTYAEECDLYHHQYAEVCEFEGDEDLDFVGDPVVTLEDTSRWKIHPHYVEPFSGWVFGERLHVGLRTDWYWFKREHKFFLVNHDRGESIPVMMVWPGDEPLTVTYVEREQTTAKGTPVTLSDGSAWEVENCQLDMFVPGLPVYIGYHHAGDHKRYFLISGTEKNAVWNFADRKHP